MKHLLNGVTIAAALAIAAPVWAQTGAPMSPSAPAAPPAASAAPAELMAATPHHRARPHRVARQGMRGTGKARADNGMTEQLNREELSRIQTGGGIAPMAAPAPMPMGTGGPRPSGH
jgi:hypothetical protein